MRSITEAADRLRGSRHTDYIQAQPLTDGAGLEVPRSGQPVTILAIIDPSIEPAIDEYPRA
jgi:hypothetical protein